MDRQSRWVATHVARLLDDAGLSQQWVGPKFTGAVHWDSALAVGIIAATLARAGESATPNLLTDTYSIWSEWDSSLCRVDATLKHVPMVLRIGGAESERWTANLIDNAQAYFRNESAGTGFRDEVANVSAAFDALLASRWTGYGLVFAPEDVWFNISEALLGEGGLYAEGGYFASVAVPEIEVAALSSALQGAGLAINYSLYRNGFVSDGEYQKLGGKPSTDISGLKAHGLLRVLTESDMRAQLAFSAQTIPEYGLELLPYLIAGPESSRDALLFCARRIAGVTIAAGTALA